MGSGEYSKRLNTLLVTEGDIQKIVKDKGINIETMEDTRPLTYLLQSADRNDLFFLELQQAFGTFIKKEEFLLLPSINAIVIGNPKDKRLITNDNFSDFQTILRIQNRRKVPEPPPENESAFAKRMRLMKEQRDEVLRKQQAKENGGEQDLADLLLVADVYGIDYLKKSIYAFYELIPAHQRREKWNTDIEMLCAGADPAKVKAKHWMAKDS